MTQVLWRWRLRRRRRRRRRRCQYVKGGGRLEAHAASVQMHVFAYGLACGSKFQAACHGKANYCHTYAAAEAPEQR